MKGMTDLKTIYPECQNGIISRMDGNIFGYHGWGSVCEADGALFAACSAFRVNHVCPFGKTALYRSLDGGRTWSVPLVVNDTALDDRDAGIVSLGENRLLITWFIHPADVYINHYFKDFTVSEPKDALIKAQLGCWAESRVKPSAGGSFLRVSEDGGFTWGKTVRIPVSSPHGPVALSDGTLLYLGKEMYSDKIEKGSLAVFKSTADAKSWELLSYIDIPEGLKPESCHEPHLIQLKNGRLLGAVRVEAGRPSRLFTVFTCYSDDMGRSWSKLVPTNIEGSPPHLLQHSSGAVLMSVGRRIKPYGERVYASLDGGEMWDREYVLRDDGQNGDLGYPCTAELADGSLITVYYQAYGDDKNPSFLYSKWHLS